MPFELLDRFARLLTTDTDACSELFAPDALFVARLGRCELRFVGRSEIRRFLQHVPRQVTFAARSATRAGPHWVGELVVGSNDLAPRAQPVRFEVAEGQFQRFEQLG